MVHNAEVQAVDTDAIAADEMWSFVEKNTHHCLPEELEAGDCWIALSLAQLNGLILCGRVGKRTDSLAIELVTSTQGRTDCKEWHTDGWSGYERVLCIDDEVEHYIGKILTQRLERTNGSLRQQTARWHRRQNKFAKVWKQTKVTLRLVIGYFNWIWLHSRARNYGGSTSRPNVRTLDLAGHCSLSHALLRHYPHLRLDIYHCHQQHF
jgi:insertion element IS1 protein InsB